MKCPRKPEPSGPTIGVDLGVNTLLAATDGETAVLVSGREAKATVQWRNKRLASLVAKQAAKTKGSRRWKRLQKRKRMLLAKADRRLKDVLHQGTRQIANAFPGAKGYVGKPFNDAAQRMRRRQAQTVSQASNRKLIQLSTTKRPERSKSRRRTRADVSRLRRPAAVPANLSVRVRRCGSSRCDWLRQHPGYRSTR